MSFAQLPYRLLLFLEKLPHLALPKLLVFKQRAKRRGMWHIASRSGQAIFLSA